MKKLMVVREWARFAALALLVGMAVVGCATPAADPMQVAEAHVANEFPAVRADAAAWAAEQIPLTRAVGAEAIAAAIDEDDLKWRYEPAIDEGGDRFAIRAIAEFNFYLGNPQGGSAVIVSVIPYDIVVDARAGSALTMDAVYSEAGLGWGGDYEFEDDDQ